MRVQAAGRRRASAAAKSQASRHRARRWSRHARRSARAVPTGSPARRRRIREHEGQAVLRIARVERQIGAAGLENAEQADQHLQRTLKAQADYHLGPDPATAQMMRQLVGARIKLR